MASIAGWWAVPAVALLLIVLWTTWRGRTRRAPGMYDTVAHYERFQAVLTRVVTADQDGDQDTEPDRAADSRPGGAPRSAPGTGSGAGRDARAARDPKAAEPRAAARRDVP